MRFSLVDVGFSGANEGRDAMSANKAGVGVLVKAVGVGDRCGKGAEDGSGSGTGVFGIVTAIGGPEEWGLEGVGNVLYEA